MPSLAQPHPPLPTSTRGTSTALRRLTSVVAVGLLAVGGSTLVATPAQADSGDGTALGWGYNDAEGQTNVPPSLAGKDVIAISAFDGHNLVATSDGAVTAWGANTFGQTDVPASLDGQTVVDVGAGCSHSLALTDDGHITAWGDNSAGQTDVPASLGDKTVTAISAGCGHNLALTDDGHVTAWGGNGDGQSDVPLSLADKTVTAIDAGFAHSMAVTSDGQLTAWGANGSGQANVPSSLTGKTVTAVAGGLFHSVALTSDGKVTAWGDNDRNQVNVPSLVGKTVVSIEASVWHSLALTSTGELLAWGHNGQGQLNVPALPPGTGYTTMSVGHLHSVGVWAPLPIDFTTGTTATITGTAQVGQTLTADAGEVTPTPTSYTYRWLADGAPIPGATSQTLTLTAADQDAEISVEVSAIKHGYNDSTATSAASKVVGTRITGTTAVGRTLTGHSSAITMYAPEPLKKQWLRDGVPIPGADDATYVLTNADAGSSIAFQVTGLVDGVDDAPVISAAAGPVGEGVITLPTPIVTGDPVVDGTLTASLPDDQLAPADAEVTWHWLRGETRVASGSTYSPDATDAGAVLTVQATATKDYFNRVSRSTDTAEVVLATFATAPVATITGTLKVGEVLTANAGPVSPQPDSLDYQWYADGAAILGATGPTYTLTPLQKNSAITVEVTAIRAGYEAETDLSDPTAAVATEAAPDLQLDSSDSALRRGKSTTLTWTSTEAETVTASGAWTGTKAASGTAPVSPTELGAVSYVLEATNANGTTTSQVTVAVTRPAKALTVTAPKGLHLTGAALKINTRGLERGEQYTVRVGGVQVATGTATSTGAVSRLVTVPSRARDGLASVIVTGSTSDRTGVTRTHVLTNKALGIRVAKRSARAGTVQSVTISGLASDERVNVRFLGKRVSPSYAHANAQGRYRVTFRVPARRGTYAVTATGQFAGRAATKSFRVRLR